MTDHTPAKGGYHSRIPVKPRPISARVKHAMKLRVINGLTGDEAAKAAGLSPAGFWKAQKQPHVQAYADTLRTEFVQDVETRRQVIKARAIIVGEDLLHNSASDQVKAKMVEFFAREGAQPLVNVNINGGPAPYNLTRPSATIDHQKQAIHDLQSGDDASQAIDITPQSDD
jgi:hypothetical protein